MSVLFNKEQNELIVTCDCQCEESIHIKINKDEYDYYCFLSYMNGKFYSEQNSSWENFKRKFHKIWAIIKNKDFYYSDVIMSKENFEEFVKYINKQYVIN